MKLKVKQFSTYIPTYTHKCFKKKLNTQPSRTTFCLKVSICPYSPFWPPSQLPCNFCDAIVCLYTYIARMRLDIAVTSAASCIMVNAIRRRYQKIRVYTTHIILRFKIFTIFFFWHLLQSPLQSRNETSSNGKCGALQYLLHAQKCIRVLGKVDILHFLKI